MEKTKAEQYKKIVDELLATHNITPCYACNCRTGTEKILGHSRAHVHIKERKICLSSEVKGYISFFTALHEIGHIVAEKANYTSGVPRSLAEHNATEWAYTELRRQGIPIKRKMRADYDAYINNKIERGVRRGLAKIPSVLRKKFKQKRSRSKNKIK